MSATAVAQPPAATQTPPPPPLTPERAIELYIKLRDKKVELEHAHKEQLKPYNDALAKLENTLLGHLIDAGVDNMGSKEGTAYKTTRTSVTVNGWSKTLEYIQSNDAWELLDARVSKTAALAVIEETKADIPGVVVRREVAVNVRRS